MAQTARRFTTLRAISALIFRDMSATYGRSPGGYLWLVLEPVAAIALLSVAFSLAFRSPSIGENFPLFYATAFLPFAFFNQASMKMAQVMQSTRSLLMFPTVTFVDALAARFLLELIIMTVVSVLIFGGIALIFDERLILEPLVILNAVGMVLVLAAGVGTLNAYMFSTFPVFRRLWQVATRPLFILSGIFFILDDVPDDWQWILLLNPLFHATSGMRDGFYPTYEAHYILPVFPYALGVACLFLGLLLLYRHHDEIIWK